MAIRPAEYLEMSLSLVGERLHLQMAQITGDVNSLGASPNLSQAGEQRERIEVLFREGSKVLEMAREVALSMELMTKELSGLHRKVTGILIGPETDDSEGTTEDDGEGPSLRASSIIAAPLSRSQILAAKATGSGNDTPSGNTSDFERVVIPANSEESGEDSGPWEADSPLATVDSDKSGSLDFHDDEGSDVMPAEGEKIVRVATPIFDEFNVVA